MADERSDLKRLIEQNSATDVLQIFAETHLPRREEKAAAEVPASQAEIRCSFCGKSGARVKAIISGPGVNICSGCIDICNGIIRLSDAEDDPVDTLP